MIPNNPVKIPAYLAEIKNYTGLTLEELERDDLLFFQLQDSFRYGSEQVLLAHFAANLFNPSELKSFNSGQKSCNVLDAGAGSGILTVLMSALLPASQGVAVEIMERPFKLLQANLKVNNLDKRFQAVQGDISQMLAADQVLGAFDLAVANPPYFKKNSGPQKALDQLSQAELENVYAKTEVAVDLESYLKFISINLRQGGKLAIVHRAERLAETVMLCQKYKLNPFYLRAIKSTAAASTKMFLLAAVKNKPSSFSWGKDMVIYQADGSFTEEVAGFYNRNN